MNWQQIGRFLMKSSNQKRTTMRFFIRKGLAYLPYAPVRLRLAIPPNDEVKFWWSYVSESDFADRRLFDYWGNDVGELRLLRRVLRPGMVFFDVGAYHGLYTIIARKIMHGSGTVVAFEPSPREFSRLHLHLRLNGIAGVRVEQFAVGAQRGNLTLFTVLEGHRTMNSLVRPPLDNPVSAVGVESIALDEYVELNGVERIDVMKVDTEGAELQVFEGAKRLLSEYRPIMICEILDWVTKGWGYAAKEIAQHVQSHGYAWFDFHEDGSLSPHQLRETYPEVRNYLAVPSEKIDRIASWIRQ